MSTTINAHVNPIMRQALNTVALPIKPVMPVVAIDPIHKKMLRESDLIALNEQLQEIEHQYNKLGDAIKVFQANYRALVGGL